MSGILSLRTLFHLVMTGQYYFACYYFTYVFYLPPTKEYSMFHDFGGHFRFLTNWDLQFQSRSVPKMLRLIFHLVMTIQYWFAAYYDLNYVIIPSSLDRINFAGKWKYLTFWDTIIQAIFFTICLLNDLFGSNDVKPKKTPRLRKIKDFYLRTLAFPVAAMVSTTFWGLYAIDRELVFPKVLDGFFPVWLNHIVHTNVLVFSLVEMISTFREYPKTKGGPLFLMGFNLLYITWTFIIYGKTGRWVYPVLEVQNWPQRICFFASLFTYQQILYYVGRAINNRVWRSELKELKRERLGTELKNATDGADEAVLCTFNTVNEDAEQAKN